MGKEAIKIQRFTVVDPVYHFQVTGIYGGTEQEAINWYARKLHVEPWKLDEGNRWGHFTCYRPFKNSIIWFKDKYPPANVVAHECFHAVMYLFETFGMKGPTEDSEEVFAYYLQWLVSKLYFVRMGRK